MNDGLRWARMKKAERLAGGQHGELLRWQKVGLGCRPRKWSSDQNLCSSPISLPQVKHVPGSLSPALASVGLIIAKRHKVCGVWRGGVMCPLFLDRLVWCAKAQPDLGSNTGPMTYCGTLGRSLHCHRPQCSHL